MLVGPIDKEAIEHVEKVVAAGSVNGPVVWQRLPRRQNFFRDDIEGPGRSISTAALPYAVAIAIQGSPIELFPIDIRELIALRTDFFRNAAQVGALHSEKILMRIKQSVRMIDAEAGDFSLCEPGENALMELLEYLRPLHAKRGQIVDIEKSPVINFV